MLHIEAKFNEKTHGQKMTNFTGFVQIGTNHLKEQNDKKNVNLHVGKKYCIFLNARFAQMIYQLNAGYIQCSHCPVRFKLLLKIKVIVGIIGIPGGYVQLCGLRLSCGGRLC